MDSDSNAASSSSIIGNTHIVPCIGDPAHIWVSPQRRDVAVAVEFVITRQIMLISQPDICEGMFLQMDERILDAAYGLLKLSGDVMPKVRLPPASTILFLRKKA